MQTHKLYLNGRWVSGDEELTVSDPGTGQPAGRIGTVGREAAWQAIDDAHASWDGWRKLTGRQRGDCLLAAAEALGERGPEVARTITLENGKPLSESRAEVDVAVDHLRWFAEEARRGYGRVVPPQTPGKRHLVIQQPIGVAAAIAPWNFPLFLAARKVAPALAAGCPVILRPASQTPLSAVALAECIEHAGVPGAAFQLIAGPARDIADAFMKHPLCRKLSFTGSTEVGKQLIEQSAGTVTHLSLELGGHAPVLVFDDADLERAVEVVAAAKFRNGGQSCIAANRIYVQGELYEPFLEALCERSRALHVGHGLEDGVQVGPLVNEAALKHALEHIEDAERAGASLRCGGERLDRPGSFLRPTVLADVPDEARCMREETFAPVAPVSSFETEAEVIQRANASPYGLAAYVCTRDLNRAWRVAEALEAGMVAVNDPVPSSSNAPFGGVKESGLGRELGREGMEAFMEIKHISFAGVD